jgi:hypothetical protein
MMLICLQALCWFSRQYHTWLLYFMLSDEIDWERTVRNEEVIDLRSSYLSKGTSS